MDISFHCLLQKEQTNQNKNQQCTCSSSFVFVCDNKEIMPEDSKKHQHKAKHDAKEQRRPRQARHQTADKKVEKKPEEPKVPPPTKPVYENPGPEFYKGLKRETEDILKITEEANAKYKKKEIQSNWAKYEMPIDSYEEIEEQENMGADYEKLVETPLSIGGHFQFKHEKSWDINTGPSLYDRYFDINMDNLSIALQTIPFYERNGIDSSIFSPTDILTMNNRSIRYKQKYYNDKSFSTPELEAQDKLLNAFKESFSKTEENREDLYTEEPADINEAIEKKSISESNDIVFNESRSNMQENSSFEKRNVDKIINDETVTTLELPEIKNSKGLVESKKDDTMSIVPKNLDNKVAEDIDELILGKIASNVATSPVTNETLIEKDKIDNNTGKVATDPEKLSKVADDPALQAKNPVIQSPEDLEKWLDDFLDG